ncbi:MAG: hypothetical protein AAGK97_06135, partial [Bacteroidota bacterium]
TLKFKNEFKKELRHSDNNQFDSLSTRIKIVESQNKLLTIYSWDEKTGGSWHSIRALAKFRTEDHKFKVIEITGGSAEGDELTGELIYQIHEFLFANKIYYLTFGWGSGGGGHHYTIVQIFEIRKDNLINCKNFFNSNENLIVRAPRSSKINLKYNSERCEITHNEFKLNEETGFFYETGSIAKWKFLDNKFRKQ